MGRKNHDVEHELSLALKKDDNTLKSIADAMSGVDWDSQVGNQIADILHAAGYEIAPPDPARVPPAACPKCGKREDLYVTETYVAMHPYNAQRHTAENALGEGTDGLDDGAGDYMGLCRACGHEGELEEFGMKLLDWIDEDDDSPEFECAHEETSDTPETGLSKSPCGDCGYYYAPEES